VWDCALPSSDDPGEDIVEALTALHQDDLDLPVMFSNAVGDPILGFPELKVMRTYTLERRV